MSTLAAQNISVRLGSRLVLDAVSLEAKGGEFIAVIGANGAGKSTLLSVLAGLLKPADGRVTLNGTPLRAMTRKGLALARAYLPQNPRCEWPISVERLIALGLTPVLPAFGAWPTAFQARIDRVLAECDLVAWRDQPATTLSGGELARAMVARALIGDPPILIADEPMAGLDPRHALDAAERLRDLAREGKLVIAAMHDLTIAARFATRIVALHQGRIAADGPKETALAPPLLQRIFAVEACLLETEAGPYVDYRSIGPTITKEARR